MPQSKSAQNARIGALWTLIDVEHVQKQIRRFPFTFGSRCVTATKWAGQWPAPPGG